MKLVTINGNGGNDYDVSAHRADCADVTKAIRGHDHFFEEHESKRALWLDYNADFLDGSGAWPIHFYPCTKGLPDGGSYNTETDTQTELEAESAEIAALSAERQAELDAGQPTT